MGNERKRRDKLQKTTDITKPITLEMLGTKDDPCFGKLNDPRAKECQRCGDAELCAIAMGQLNHILRKSVEKKGSFKDIEEKKIKPRRSKKETRKIMRKRVLEMVQEQKKVKIDVVIEDLYATHMDDGFKKKSISRFLDKYLTNNSKIRKSQNTLKWNQ